MNIVTALSTIADIVGIISFILTVALLIRSETLRKTITWQKADYQKEQKSIRNKLTALRSNVREDGLFDQRIISEIRTQLYALTQRYGNILTKQDKQHIDSALQMMDDITADVDRNALCKELDYLIARFERRELA